jgi:hypothetical protein
MAKDADPFLNDPFISHKNKTAFPSGVGKPPQQVQNAKPAAAGGQPQARWFARTDARATGKADGKADVGANGSSKKSPGRSYEAPSIFVVMRLALFYFLFTALLFMGFWELYKPLPVCAALFMLSFVVLHDPFRASLLTKHGTVDVESLLPSLSGDNAVDAMHIWLRIVVAWLAVLMGAVCGMNAEERYMSHYFAIEFGSEYENALASTPGAAYIDAGSMNFASSSKIDPAQSVGFKHGSTFCVAPIVDTNQGRKSIAYWAIGYDCCSARGEFDCGDTDGNKGARAPPDGFFYHDTGYFMNAVKQAAAVNDFDLDDDIVLLHWDKDPDGRKVSKFVTALGAVCLGAAIFALLAFAIIFATLLAEHEYTKDQTHHSLRQDL